MLVNIIGRPQCHAERWEGHQRHRGHGPLDPVVTISKNDSIDNTVTISQEHFVYDTDAKIQNPELFNKRLDLASKTLSVLPMCPAELHLPEGHTGPLPNVSGGTEKKIEERERIVNSDTDGIERTEWFLKQSSLTE
ncbi:hypothetical protein E1301_Tti001871 [Triplophysa tibetana]|uniref:Uncharacterized protein n=1 Tax=Triplophysa tibetana TaxID=1572043 RepID=A0A5A9PJE3_9TELE|nr:hypothetical protein E1301_Tti001871 [Triplophysa tibetana]